jgi:signal peptidase I
VDSSPVEQVCVLRSDMSFSIPRPSAIISITLSFIAIIFILAFAPTQVGGVVTYVIVDGNSMEPGFSLGDLVLVRTKPMYGVGDAVVYRNAEMNSFVFHRIVDMELGRYILQGDNNSWLDSYLPAQEEIIGKLWFHIPKLGMLVEWARIPLNMSLLVGALVGVLMFDFLKKPSTRNKEKPVPSIQFGGIPVALYILGLCGLFFLATGIYAFTRPLYNEAEKFPYQQEGYFYYSATGTPGVYDSEMVRSGEPVFPKLTCFLNIGYTYTLTGDRLQAVNGTHKMYARIMDEQSGWVRTIPLNADALFTGNSYFTLAALDLCQVEAIVNLVEKEAGLNQINYTMEIISESAFAADVNGTALTDVFSSSLVFRYDKIHFYLAPNKSQDPMRSSKAGLAGGTETTVNAISLLGLALPIWIVRFVSLLGFVFSLLGFIYVGVQIYQTMSQSEDGLIRLKYGSMLMDVYEQTFEPSSAIIDVTEMDDLAKLAERHGTMILHMQRSFLHYYFVQISGATYRYVITTGRQGVSQTASPIEKRDEAVPVIAETPPEFVPAPSEETIQPEFAPLPIPLPPQWEAMLQKSARQELEVTQPSPVYESIREPVETEEVEYIIQTGAIEFVTEPNETTILRKIKL